MTQIGSVQLTRNDGTETFDFKATSVEYSASNGVVTSSVISALREVIGGKLVIENETIVVKADVKNMDADQFPNSGTYSDDDLGFESELRRAHKEWGFDTTDGFDLLTWGPRPDFQGVFTDITVSEDTQDAEMGAGSYSVEVEWTYLDAFIS